MRQDPSSPVLGLDHIPIPTCPEQADETLQKLAASSRRSFLGRGLAAAAVPSAIVAASSLGEAASNNGNGNRVLPSYFPGQTQKLFQEIQFDEYSHVGILIAAIKSLGGTPRPYPTFQGIDISDPQAFLNLSVIFENTGVHAYLGAAPYISNMNVLGVAASIAFVEAYHSGWLNALGNQTLIPGGLPTAVPFDQAHIVAAAMPFIVSLNDPTNMFPPRFSTANGPTNPSVANDIAILNFALILEYLEATFYFNSVQKVFAKGG